MIRHPHGSAFSPFSKSQALKPTTHHFAGRSFLRYGFVNFFQRTTQE
jgi:hypothetical protein